MPSRLAPEDLAAIAGNLARMTATELARALGRDPKAVEWHVRRMRRAGGWYCVLKLPPCTECGVVVVGPPKLRAHPACAPARRARWARERRDARARMAPPTALAEQRARAAERAKRHYHDAPEERKALLLAEAHARLRHDYGITREVADSNGLRWSADDDRYLLENRTLPARELALALGRTTFSVYQRRAKLRRERAPRTQGDGSGSTSSGPSLATTLTAVETG